MAGKVTEGPAENNGSLLLGHMRASCSGPGSALEAYVRIWIIFTIKAAVEIDTNFQHRTVDPSRYQRNATV